MYIVRTSSITSHDFFSCEDRAVNLDCGEFFTVFGQALMETQKTCWPLGKLGKYLFKARGAFENGSRDRFFTEEELVKNLAEDFRLPYIYDDDPVRPDYEEIKVASFDYSFVSDMLEMALRYKEMWLVEYAVTQLHLMQRDKSTMSCLKEEVLLKYDREDREKLGKILVSIGTHDEHPYGCFKNYLETKEKLEAVLK